MAKSSNAMTCSCTDNQIQDDAETRAFLDRPSSSSVFASILQLILIIAMAVAMAKIALVFLVRA